MLCAQVNNDIYIADGARNMLPDLSKKQTYVPSKQEEKSSLAADYIKYSADKVAEKPSNIFGTIIMGTLFVTLAPIGLISNSVGNLVEGCANKKDAKGL